MKLGAVLMNRPWDKYPSSFPELRLQEWLKHKESRTMRFLRVLRFVSFVSLIFHVPITLIFLAADNTWMDAIHDIGRLVNVSVTYSWLGLLIEKLESQGA
jgi:hypothetical protein